LAINVDKLNEMHDALGTFNEAFAGYMYALKMNAFCVEWDEVCGVELWPEGGGNVVLVQKRSLNERRRVERRAITGTGVREVQGALCETLIVRRRV
jgi:hypothetical protein